MGLISGWRRSTEKGNGNLLQYACLENSIDRGDWQSTVHGISKSWTRLSTHVHAHHLYADDSQIKPAWTALLNLGEQTHIFKYLLNISMWLPKRYLKVFETEFLHFPKSQFITALPKSVNDCVCLPVAQTSNLGVILDSRFCYSAIQPVRKAFVCVLSRKKGGTPTMENSMTMPEKTEIRVAILSSNLIPGHISGQNYNSKWYMHPCVHISAIHNSQDVETN